MNKELDSLMQECSAIADNISTMRTKSDELYTKLRNDIDVAYYAHVYPVLNDLTDVLLNLEKASDVPLCRAGYVGNKKVDNNSLFTKLARDDINWGIETSYTGGYGWSMLSIKINLSGALGQRIRVLTSDRVRPQCNDMFLSTPSRVLGCCVDYRDYNDANVEYLAKLQDMLVVHHGDVIVNALRSHVAMLLKAWKPHLLEKQAALEGIISKLEDVLTSVPDSTAIKEDGTVDIVLNGKHYVGSVKEV